MLRYIRLTSLGGSGFGSRTPEYRNGSRGADLLAFLEQQARSHGRYKLFALTTRTAHWFVERGFSEVNTDTLPKPAIRLIKMDDLKCSPRIYSLFSLLTKKARI